jgi:general secretion pathway protein D
MKLMNRKLHSTILALLLSGSAFADCSYELFSISSTKDTKIIEFIEQLSDECQFSIIVTDPHAEEFLNTKLNKTHLKNLTIDEVLTIVLNENNLSYTLENNVLKISYLTTKVFNIDYVLSQRKGTGSTDITLSSQSNTQAGMNGSTGISGSSATGTSGQQQASGAQSGIKIESSDEVKFWEELDLEFQRVLNRPQDTYVAQTPIINKNAGLITITATTKQMKRFEDYLKKLQDKVQLQVLIDVQLLSVTLSDSQTTGIDWKQIYALQNVELSVHKLQNKNVSTWEDGTNGVNITETEIAADAINGAASLVSFKAGGTLTEVIKFLQTQGDVNAISNPKVLTLNNQPALITAGTEYFYKLQSSTNQQGAGGTVAATTQNDQVQSVFAGVLLSITPEIADDNSITLIINPSLSETSSIISAESNTGRSMPPDLNRRQLSSVVTVKDGNRIILGGLITTTNNQESRKVPLLGDIPVINYLFKYDSNVKTVQELVIIIEPHIVKRENDSLSLSDLGYEGLSNDLLKSNKTAPEQPEKK